MSLEVIFKTWINAVGNYLWHEIISKYWLVGIVIIILTVLGVLWVRGVLWAPKYAEKVKKEIGL